MLEALWLHQNHNVVNESLLRRTLRSPDSMPGRRRHASLCYWRDRVQNPLALLRTQINDEHPRVRLEAIRALSFLRDDAAIGVALELLAHPDDEYLRFTFNETLNTLERRAGAKVDRKNIASSLLAMIEKGKVPGRAAIGAAGYHLPPWRHEGAHRGVGPCRQRRTIPPSLRIRVLEWFGRRGNNAAGHAQGD